MEIRFDELLEMFNTCCEKFKDEKVDCVLFEDDFKQILVTRK